MDVDTGAIAHNDIPLQVLTAEVLKKLYGKGEIFKFTCQGKSSAVPIPTMEHGVFKIKLENIIPFGLNGVGTDLPPTENLTFETLYNHYITFVGDFGENIRTLGEHPLEDIK